MFLHVLEILITSALICSAAPTLEEEHCGKPGHIEGATLKGVWNAESYSPGRVATFTCTHGYAREGSIKMACIEGSWIDVSRGQCKILGHCSKPQQSHENGELQGQWNDETFPPGKVATYICRQGYSQTSPIKNACVEGEWIPISKGQCIADSCTEPPKIQNGETKGLKKKVYSSGETVTYECLPGFTMGQNANYITCQNSAWTEPPICRRMGQSCIAPPVVQNGDTIELKRLSHPSGTSVKYKCANFYKLEGQETITCRDGEWEKQPICRVPCTVRDIDMQQNNIQLKYRGDRKLYTEHGDSMSFLCIRGYTISDEKSLRVQCLDGVIKFPKCRKEGMEQSCTAPPVVQYGDTIEVKQLNYPSGTSVKYKCANYYKLEGLEGQETITCRDGEWEKEPICRGPCTVRDIDMQQNNIQFKYRGDRKLYAEHGHFMSFVCIRGYTISDETSLRVQCLDGVIKYPKCRKEGMGQFCTAPPVVQYGDTIELKQLSYPSGTSVKYKCANYYKLEGQETITCRDGEWEKEPICRVPCTVRDIDMQQNNIQLKFRGDGKLYAEHGDSFSFVCIRGYTISVEKSLRVQCLDGVIKYPKCRKEGFCVLQQKDMFQNNIQYIKSNEIDNGETIDFECLEGMVPENDLKATCSNAQIKYPVCSPGSSCLPPKISNALVSPEKNSYASGSSIDIKCENTYVLDGNANVKCMNRQWDELPQCYKPCTISAEIVDRNHIEIKSLGNSSEPLEHGTDINVKCKTNFRRPGSLKASCYDGIMIYPRCFSGGFCRVNQQDLDDNNLELDERHENEVFYGEEEIVHFKCKAGYSSRTELTGRCTKPERATQYELTYPVCEPSSR